MHSSPRVVDKVLSEYSKFNHKSGGHMVTKATILCDLARKYKTDKCERIKHPFTPFYYDLFSPFQHTVKKLLEIGAGEGRSLRMWREFFPNAKIFGIDNRPKRIFRENNLEILNIDQTNSLELTHLIEKIGNDIDIVIDDGSHIPTDQISTCMSLMPLLKDDVIYIIEDVKDLSISESLEKYNVSVIRLRGSTGRRYPDDNLIVVRKKEAVDTQEYIIKKMGLHIAPVGVTFIPDLGREDLAFLFKELGFKTGAEIGVDRGTFSETLCKANPDLHLYSIDPWLVTAYTDPINKKEGLQRRFSRHAKEAMERLSKYNCTVMRESSLSAAQKFSDDFFDFVYIDANHDFVNITNDIDTWLKKVRVGGIISGHDYTLFPASNYNHVKYVVDAYCKSHEITPYFELGKERVHLWFWVKQ